MSVKVSQTEQDNKVNITEERAEYVRENKDQPIEDLQEATGLTEYAVEVIIEAFENDFWLEKENNYHGTRKWEKLSDDMVNALYKANKYDHGKGKTGSWRALTKWFNEKFKENDLTPISITSLKKYYKRIKQEKEYLGTKDVAEMTGYKQETVSRKCRDGIIEYEKPKNQLKIPPEEVEKLKEYKENAYNRG